MQCISVHKIRLLLKTDIFGLVPFQGNFARRFSPSPLQLHFKLKHFVALYIAIMLGKVVDLCVVITAFITLIVHTRTKHIFPLVRTSN